LCFIFAYFLFVFDSDFFLVKKFLVLFPFASIFRFISLISYSCSLKIFAVSLRCKTSDIMPIFSLPSETKFLLQF
jgi:hypothetical protein